MPAPSWPRIAGKSPSGSAPERVNSSVWQMPVALISTSTSPAFGPASWTVSMASGAPARCATAARTSTVISSLAAGLPQPIYALVELLVLALGERHGLGLELLGGAVEPDEGPPAREQEAHGHEERRAVKELRWIFAQRLERGDEPLHRKRHHDHHHEAREEPPHAR